MKEIMENRFCEHCDKETEHLVSEDALAIDYICQICNSEQEVVKTFF